MKRKRLVIIGMDSFAYDWLDPFIKRGYLNAMKKVMEEGSLAIAEPPIFDATASNWAIIATGANPSTHGCGMAVHMPGDPLDKFTRAFPSQYIQAEQIWVVANKAGKKCILFDCTQSWPPNIDKLIHVGEDGRPDNTLRAIQEAKGYVTNIPPTKDPFILRCRQEHLCPVDVKTADNWANIPSDIKPPPLEVRIPIKPSSHPQARYRGRTVHPDLYLLITGDDEGYNKVSLHVGRDYNRKIGETTLGKWSDWIIHEFSLDGEPVNAAFRMKLLKLSKDGKDLHVYFSEIYPTKDFAYPEKISEELLKVCGPFLNMPTRQQVGIAGATDIYTFMEEMEYQGNWFANAAAYLLDHYDWDFLFIKWHMPDFLNHLAAYMIDPFSPLYDESKADEGWKLWGKVLDAGDNIVKKVLERTDENDIVAIVSDHGSQPIDYLHFRKIRKCNEILLSIFEKEGLLYRDANGKIVWSKTKVFGRTSGDITEIWVNLKGRDPDGIVEPGDEYEYVRDQIIQILLNLKDPETGYYIYNLVCRREDAAIFGYGGERAADIFAWIIPSYSRRRKYTAEEIKKMFPDVELGTWEWPSTVTGVHSRRGIFILKAPGVKHGYQRKKPVPLSYIAPTLCYLWGLRTPANADGGIIWDFLE